MFDVNNPRIPREDGSYYFICAKCEREIDVEDSVEDDMQAIEEFEDVFNIKFDSLSAEDKITVCDDCFQLIMRMN